MSCVICGEEQILDNRCERCGWTQPIPQSPALQIFDATLLGFLIGIFICLGIWIWSVVR